MSENTISLSILGKHLKFFVLILTVAAVSSPPASAQILEGAIGGGLGGAIIGGILGGSDGAAIGATLGGMSGALEGAAEVERREYYYRERERRRWEREREYERDRARYMDCYETGYRGHHRCYHGR